MIKYPEKAFLNGDSIQVCCTLSTAFKMPFQKRFLEYHYGACTFHCNEIRDLGNKIKFFQRTSLVVGMIDGTTFFSSGLFLHMPFGFWVLGQS